MIAPLKLLLVEDNPDDAFLLIAAFSATNGGLQVTHVERLRDALQKLTEDRFDVVLLDLSLPDSSGLSSLESLRDQIPDIPVVVLTGLDDPQTALEAVRK